MTKKTGPTLFDWIEKLASGELSIVPVNVSEFRNTVAENLKHNQIVAARAELNLLKDFKTLIESRIKIGEQNLIELTTEKKENKPNDYSKITWTNYGLDTWVTSDGRAYPIRAMDSKHIKNCVIFLKSALSNTTLSPTKMRLFNYYIIKFEEVLRDRGWAV